MRRYSESEEKPGSDRNKNTIEIFLEMVYTLVTSINNDIFSSKLSSKNRRSETKLGCSIMLQDNVRS